MWIRLLPRCLSLSSSNPNTQITYGTITFKPIILTAILFHVSSGEFRLLMDLVKVGTSIRTMMIPEPESQRMKLDGPKLLWVPILGSITKEAVLTLLMHGTSILLRSVPYLILISTSHSTKTGGSRFQQYFMEEQITIQQINFNPYTIWIGTALVRMETANKCPIYSHNDEDDSHRED